MSWQEEKQSAWLYRQVAQAETDARMRQLFVTLADAADAQASIWGQVGNSAFKPSLRARLVAGLLRHIPARRLRPVLAAMKLRGLSAYDVPVHLGHVRPDGHVMPKTLADVGISHRRIGGSNLRAAVFGVNDGLVSNACLIMGVSGASIDNHLVLTTGIAGLLAGALSMAAGEYVSMRSQREMYEHQISMERAELDEYPTEEAEELALIYQARGMDLDKARDFATSLMRDPAHALDVLSREELGLNPDDLGSPWGAAMYSFLAFALGACIPLLPFAIGATAGAALRWSCIVTALCLFLIGMTLSLFTGRNALRSGLRMLLIGGGAGLITYAIGRGFGA